MEQIILGLTIFYPPPFFDLTPLPHAQAVYQKLPPVSQACISAAASFGATAGSCREDAHQGFGA